MERYEDEPSALIVTNGVEMAEASELNLADAREENGMFYYEDYSSTPLHV